MDAIIYDLNTGQILRNVTAPNPESQAGSGEGVIKNAWADDGENYIDVGTKEIVPMPAKPSEHHDFDWSAKQWVSNLAKAKRLRWDEVKAEADAALEGGFEYNGMTFASDLRSQVLMQGATTLAQTRASQGQPFSETWTLADDSTVTLGANEMVAAAQAMGSHVSKVYEARRIARQQINAAADVDAVLAVDYSAILGGL